MNDQQTFHIILDDCIDAVLEGRATIADCVARYPDYADDLKPELQVAVLAARLKSPAMPAARVDALEASLRAQTPAPRKIIAFPPALSRIAAVIALVMVFAFAGGGGVVAASADSVPGDTLYPVKRSWEQIIVLIASITGDLDDVWLQLADTRLDEAKIVTARGEISPAVLDDLREATANAMQYAYDMPELDSYLDELAASLERGDVLAPDEATTQAILDLIAPQTTPPPVSTPVQTPTLTPTHTATVTFTATASPTEDLPAQIVEATDTATPRFPPTPTRTPTPTVTRTPTLTPSIVSSATFTPLPPPTLRQVPTVSVGTRVASPTPAFGFTPDPNGTWYPYPQLTQDIFYITRTAEARETLESGD